MSQPMQINSSIVSETIGFRPQHLVFPDSWVGHIPFAAWLIAQMKPTSFVELGTYSGNSYFSFCQSVAESKVATRCFAVDTWKGDEHSGPYSEKIFANVSSVNAANYASFSTLIRSTFDEASRDFNDGSVDLLHIDGLHTYEAVRHDFQTWLPKLSEHAIVLFHDTDVREKDFGVWQFWDELTKSYPLHINFSHSHGLGVLQISSSTDRARFDWLRGDNPERESIIDWFCQLGHFVQLDYLARKIMPLDWKDPRDSKIEHLETVLLNERDAFGSLWREYEALQVALMRETAAKGAEHNALIRKLGPLRQELDFQSSRLARTLEAQKNAEQAVAQKEAQLRDAIADIQRLKVIETSTAWRSTWIVRKAFERSPATLRRSVRKFIRAGFRRLKPRRLIERLRTWTAERSKNRA